MVVRCRSCEMLEGSVRFCYRLAWILGWADAGEAGVSRGRLVVTDGGRRWPQSMVGTMRERGIGKIEKEERERWEKEREKRNIFLFGF